MRMKVLACETLFREIHLAAAHSVHLCDVKFLPRQCHDDLQLMRAMLQTELQAERPCDIPGVRCPACGDARYDYVVLAMGLCGNTTLGLRAAEVPLVLPKVHDCYGLLLGGNGNYLRSEFRTVFYHQGAVERLGAALVDAVPKKYGLGRSLEEYIQQYGEDNGRYIHELEHTFVGHNERALVISHETSPTARRCLREVTHYVRRFGWRVEQTAVDMRLFHRLLAGDWDEAEFVIVPPGEEVRLRVEPDGIIATATRTPCGSRKQLHRNGLLGPEQPEPATRA